jgi:hypothetical protein
MCGAILAVAGDSGLRRAALRHLPEAELHRMTDRKIKAASRAFA